MNFLTEEDDVTEHNNKHNHDKEGKYHIWRHKIDDIFEMLVPLSGKIKQIKFDFNPTGVSFFLIYKYLNGLSIANFIPYLYMFIIHNFHGSDQGMIASYNMLDRGLVTGSFVPKFMLYSAFDTNMAVLYSSNLFIFILIGLIAIIYKFSNFDYDDFMSR